MATGAGRRLWLDWQRGLAVLYMLEWHSYDSWRSDAVFHGRWHGLIQTVGGFAAPSFLYMAGLSQVLADASLERKGVAPGARRLHALRRALWLLGVAFLFRLAEYLLGGGTHVPGGWRDIFRVDVLNVIAVSLVLSALFTAGVPGRLQGWLAAGAAAGVALLSPVVAGWPHPESRLLDYLYCEWPRGIFPLFPWAVFVFAGSAFGRLSLRGMKAPGWLAAGAALFFGGWLADKLPAFYAHQDFWRVSPCWAAMRLGMVVFTSGLLQLLPERADRGLSWLRTLGRHSLLGYFVSVEIPYGALSRGLQKQLGLGAVLGAIAGMIVVTWACSVAADRYDAWRAARARRAGAAPPRAAA